jgi:CRISPR-associated protein Csh1
MIKEITNFVDELEKNNPDIFSKNLNLKEGLYIFLDFEEKDGKCILKNADSDGNIKKEDIKVYGKNAEWNHFFERCLKIQTNSIPVSNAKIFNPNKKIYNVSCSPFTLSFNKKNFIKYDKEILLSELNNQYFKIAEQYLNNDKETHFKWFRCFRKFIIENFPGFITELTEYQNAKTNFTINIFLKNPSIEDFKETHEAYLKEKVFNKDKYNLEIDNITYGISDSLSLFQEKKPFLQHQTAPLKYNYRVEGNDAMKLWKFFQMQKNKQLPNPMPVFIDKQELNDKVVSLYNNEGKITYSAIVKELIENHDEDLQNYYLIFFNNTYKKSRIVDLDFVPVFKYNIESLKLTEFFNLGGQFSSIPVNNVFDLQTNVINKIFNNQLVRQTKNNGLWLRYFDEIEIKPEYGLTDSIYHLLYKYRKAFYDYIYKSRHQAINHNMFDDMMIQSILDDIMHDQERDKEYNIKQKLNIWFSLYNYFNHTNKNREDMASKIPELTEKCRKIANEGEQLSDKPEEFAFAAGQIIYFLLSKSEASNKSHALLEPFLQKSKASLLQDAISKTINTYKHAIGFGKSRFENLAKEVLAYETNVNMKTLQRYLLAGYFADSVIYEKKENNEPA